MENTLAVAKKLSIMYQDCFNQSIDEMKMHKLMYFTQRESIIVNGDILFPEDFCGWKYGPVLLSVRSEFITGNLFENIVATVSDTTEELLKSVIKRFGKISSWDLSILSHEEISWKLSRNGLKASENGTTHLSLAAMKLDAAREAAARKK